MTTSLRHSFLLTSVLLSYFSCTGDPASLGVRSERTLAAVSCPPGAVCRDTVSVTFLGVGGFVVRHGAHAVMTAPLFTHPNLPSVISRGGADRDLVTRMLDSIDRSGIEAVILGHSHYDHLMDVPATLHALTPTPMLYGSSTTKHVLAGDSTIEKSGIIAIDTSQAASATRNGEWYYVQDPSGRRRFRLKAVMSTHAPNLSDVTISNYTLIEDLDSLPPTPFDWPKGEVFAYIIDVLSDNDAVLFRIYYQDSASDPEHSQRPKLEFGDTHNFDLVIVCGGNFDKAKSYPTTVLRAFDPSFAIVGHWDNFFRHVDKEPRLIPGLNGSGLRHLMHDSMGDRWAALRPLSTAVFAIASTSR
jgi:hypothetical protein